MDMFESIPIKENFQIEVRQEKTSYPEAVEREVERIWVEEKGSRGDALYNGTFLNLIAIEEERIIGTPSQYRYLLAQYIKPQLQETLKMTPIAITGITIAERKYLIGKRSDRVLTHHGEKEFVPAGGIEEGILDGTVMNVDLELLREFQEETAIPFSLVRHITPFMLIKQGRGRPVELCAYLELAKEAASHLAFPTKEHTAFFWMTKEELVEDVRLHPASYVPLTAYLVNRFF